MADSLELILDARSVVGEGAIWDEEKQVLFWVDMFPGLVHVYDPASGKDHSMRVGQPVGTVVPRASGGLMLAVRDGFMSLDPESGRTELVAAPPGHEPENLFNDGKCDPAGRFWAGTKEAPARKGALFRLDRDLSVHRMLGDIACSNGLAWSLDKKTMYYIDSVTMKIEAFQYEIMTGVISNRRTVVSVAKEHGIPDGMTIDAEGKLWVAHWDGWCVCRWDPPTGDLIRKVRLPVARPTSCAFGGPMLDTLYITSATFELNAATLEKQPSAGGLFRFKPGARGLPAFSFRG
jgi:sugar lactone lactonase YvrE